MNAQWDLQWNFFTLNLIIQSWYYIIKLIFFFNSNNANSTQKNIENKQKYRKAKSEIFQKKFNYYYFLEIFAQK